MFKKYLITGCVNSAKTKSKALSTFLKQDKLITVCIRLDKNSHFTDKKTPFFSHAGM